MRRSLQAYLVLLALLAPLATNGGARAAEPQYEQVSFSVQAESELQNDLAEAALAVEGEDPDPAKVAADINRTMAWALDQAHAAAGVAVQTADYQTYPIYDQGRLLRWHGAQTLILRSQKTEALNLLVGKLQQRLQIKGMGFIPSPERRRAAEAQLTDQALAQFKERAERIRRDLDAKGYRIVQLDLENAGTPLPMIRMSKMEAAGAPVASEAGVSRLQLTVRATIRLRY